MVMAVEYGSPTRYMNEDNQMMLDDLFFDWSLEDTPEALLDEQFFRDFYSSQACLMTHAGVSSRELGEHLGPLLRGGCQPDAEW